MHTTFIDNSNFKAQIAKSLEKIDINYQKMNLILHENLYPLEKNSFHFIAKFLKELGPSDRITKALTSTLFKNIYFGELTSAGAAEIGLKFGINFVKELLVNDLSNINEVDASKQLEKALQDFKTVLETQTKIATQTDVEKAIVASCGSDRVLSTTITEATKLAGLEGKIFVENGRQNNFLIELKEGYNFSVKPFKFMLSGPNNFWEANNCKVIIIDGLVEKVSELDQILLKTMETKVPLVIFAHGFSEEVVATLKANNEKNILNAQAVRIPSDVDSLNVANDISVVCGCQPVSSMKGDLLIFKKYEDLPIVTKIRLYENKCSIENSSTRSSVSAQIKMLLEKRQSHFLHEEVQDLYDKRIRSLASNSVVIHLPNLSSNVLDEMRVKIDLSLRQMKTILNYGTVDLASTPEKLLPLLNEAKEQNQEVRKIALKAIIETFSNEKVRPFLSSYIGCEIVAKPVLLLFMSSGFIALE
jgi:chaperonin GroEL (HSP60 family)